MTKTATYSNPPIQRDFLWTTERYEKAIATGVFTEDDNIELLYGKIIEGMPAGTSHEECVTILADFFRDRFGRAFRYREEKSIALTALDSEPEPDFVVAIRKPYNQSKPSPKDIHFIIEVANTSLERDRTIKLSLYAEAGLAEYWIINLLHRQIEVHLQPNTEQRIYESVNIYKEGSTFDSPFAGEVLVSELLPAPSEG